jgi:hypothetical protein
MNLLLGFGAKPDLANPDGVRVRTQSRATTSQYAGAAEAGATRAPSSDHRPRAGGP